MDQLLDDDSIMHVAKPVENPPQVEADEFLIKDFAQWVVQNKYKCEDVKTGFTMFEAFMEKFEGNNNNALLAACTTLGVVAEMLCSMKIYAEDKTFADVVIGDELKKMASYKRSAYLSEEDSASDFGAEDEPEDGDDNSDDGDDGDDGDVKINETKDKEDNGDVACVETPKKKVKFSDV
jgi:hypothetical protein